MISSSKVWQFYRKIPPYQAECVLCSKIIKTGGGTTNVRNHLKSKHKEYVFDDVDGNGEAFLPSKTEITEIVVEADEVIQVRFSL